VRFSSVKEKIKKAPIIKRLGFPRVNIKMRTPIIRTIPIKNRESSCKMRDVFIKPDDLIKNALNILPPSKGGTGIIFNKSP
jgi:hypothetical protein